MSNLVEMPFELFSPTAFKGFTAKTDFDLGNARAMMWMSQLAYETHRPEKIEKVRKLWEFDRVTPFVDGAIGRESFETRGVIAEGRGVVDYVPLDGDTRPLVERFYERVARPTLTDLSVDWGGLDVQEASSSLPSREPIRPCGRTCPAIFFSSYRRKMIRGADSRPRPMARARVCRTRWTRAAR